jgi:hypothetical protein
LGCARTGWQIGRAVVRASAYRTKDLLREVNRGNWDLSTRPILANGTPVDDSNPAPKVSVPAIPKTALAEAVPFLGKT